MITIKEVHTTKEIKQFIEFPLKLYKKCPYFVPPLYGDEKKMMKTGGNTENAESIFFLALKDGKVVGRIQGIIEKQFNNRHNKKQVRFTRFDSIDDKEVSKELFSSLENWAKNKGMDEICGPLGFNDLEREGLLIEGFEEDSTFEEQYNYEYYQKLIEDLGFEKDADWVESELRAPDKPNEMLKRVANRVMELKHLHIADTNISKKEYINKYRDGFFNCIDVCYRDLYGTVKISREVEDELISAFMLLINKEYALFVCDENENVVGFGICFPGIGKAIQKSGGKLTPFTLIKLLRTAKKPKVIDLGLVGVLPEYQKLGVNAIILQGMMDMLTNGKIEKCETNLNLETNKAVLAQWKYFNARQNKRRRSYIKKIGV